MTGASIVLSKCSVGTNYQHYMDYIRQTIWAEYAFWGLTANDENDLLFKGVRVEFEDIVGWCDLCKFSSDFDNETQGIIFKWNHKDPITYTVNDNLSITIAPSVHFRGGGIEEEFAAKQNIFIKLNYQNDVNWSSILEDIDSVRYLVSLGIGQRVAIARIQYRHKSIKYETEEDQIHYADADVIIGIGKDTLPAKVYPYEYWFKLNDLLQLTYKYEGWTKQYNILKPVLDLLQSVYNLSSSPEAVFLNLMQALETFHSRFITDNKNEYKDRIDGLVNQQTDGSYKDMIKNMLYDSAQERSKSIILKSRVADVLFSDGFLPLNINEPCIITFSKRIVDTRNYYTHYDPNKKERAYRREQLPVVNAYLYCLVQYHIMVLIGFDQEFAKKKVRKTLAGIEKENEGIFI